MSCWLVGLLAAMLGTMVRGWEVLKLRHKLEHVQLTNDQLRGEVFAATAHAVQIADNFRKLFDEMQAKHHQDMTKAIDREQELLQRAKSMQQKLEAAGMRVM